MEVIRYLHSSKGKVETEKVYGERWLRLIYGNPLGKVLLWASVKRTWFSRWYGWRMSRSSSKSKILPFIKKYNLDTSEFRSSIESFHSFNDFFSRKLKPSARPISEEVDSAIFPADGRHLGYQEISNMDGFFVKGQKLNLHSLLKSEGLTEKFTGGTLVISRLCPVDYHRFHFPVSGELVSIKNINGSLFSVNPLAIKKAISIFWRNKRVLTILDSQKFGQIACILVGATCVGSISIEKKGGSKFLKGDELGYFSFGGSCVMTLFEKGKVQLSSDLIDYSKQGMEVFAKMGQPMAKLNHK
ncbi:MAG: archaetidylserine decarboxylase [Verrucomicrobiota bacterium]|nr:archaetidylserine decarboxylase [Verrucomicrobiota bacterium]